MLNKKQIYEIIESLSHSQGFYCRLLEQLDNMDSLQFEEVMQKLEKQNFNDALDLILFLEC